MLTTGVQTGKRGVVRFRAGLGCGIEGAASKRGELVTRVITAAIAAGIMCGFDNTMHDEQNQFVGCILLPEADPMK